MNYLQPGHTHEDIDGLFGILASKLMVSNAFTPATMNSLFHETSSSASKKVQNKTTGLGIDIGFLPSDQALTRLTYAVPDWTVFFKVSLSLVCSALVDAQRLCWKELPCRAGSHAPVPRFGDYAHELDRREGEHGGIEISLSSHDDQDGQWQGLCILQGVYA